MLILIIFYFSLPNKILFSLKINLKNIFIGHFYSIYLCTLGLDLCVPLWDRKLYTKMRCIVMSLTVVIARLITPAYKNTWKLPRLNASVKV